MQENMNTVFSETERPKVSQPSAMPEREGITREEVRWILGAIEQVDQMAARHIEAGEHREAVLLLRYANAAYRKLFDRIEKGLGYLYQPADAEPHPGHLSPVSQVGAGDVFSRF